MGAIASEITSLTIVYSIVYSDADQRKHQSSASLAFVWGIHQGPVNFPHKWPVTRKTFPFDDVIMCIEIIGIHTNVILQKMRKICLKNESQILKLFMQASGDNESNSIWFTSRHANRWLWREDSTLRPRRNARHFADDIFKCIFLNRNVFDFG